MIVEARTYATTGSESQMAPQPSAEVVEKVTKEPMFLVNAVALGYDGLAELGLVDSDPNTKKDLTDKAVAVLYDDELDAQLVKDRDVGTLDVLWQWRFDLEGRLSDWRNGTIQPPMDPERLRLPIGINRSSSNSRRSRLARE